MSNGLRLVVFDATCKRPEGLGLSDVWRNGARFYQGLRRIDYVQGVHSVQQALDWIAQIEPSRPVAEIQFWGHGKWGSIYVGRERLDATAFEAGHAWFEPLCSIRGRLHADSLIWLRTCETFGASQGQKFASVLSAFSGCRVAGHTFVIGFWQSGLHTLLPGSAPHWPIEEGLLTGSPETPLRAAPSGPKQPNTITCLHGRVPARW